MKSYINLRKELYTLFNNDSEYTWCIVRHLTEIKCSCITQPETRIKEGTNYTEPNPNYRSVPDPECPNCEGVGRAYYEYLHKCMVFYPGYRWAHYGYEEEGMVGKNIFTVYLLSNAQTHLIYPNDVYFEIDKNRDGSIKMPIVRRRKMTIKEVQRYHLDNNKQEYIRIFATPNII